MRFEVWEFKVEGCGDSQCAVHNLLSERVPPTVTMSMLLLRI